jgi:hypothetical protein
MALCHCDTDSQSANLAKWHAINCSDGCVTPLLQRVEHFDADVRFNIGGWDQYDTWKSIKSMIVCSTLMPMNAVSSTRYILECSSCRIIVSQPCIFPRRSQPLALPASFPRRVHPHHVLRLPFTLVGKKHCRDHVKTTLCVPPNKLCTNSRFACSFHSPLYRVFFRSVHQTFAGARCRSRRVEL